MGNVPKIHKTAKQPDRIWFDDIKGMTVDDKTIRTVAKAVGGTVEGNLVTVLGNHGERVIRKGDFVGTDQVGTWHIVRLNELTNEQEMLSLGKKGNAQTLRG